MINLFIFILIVFFISFQAISCESIYPEFQISKNFFISQRCYIVPNLSDIEPEFCGFLNDSDYTYIYAEHFFIDGKSISRFSYDNRDQLNCFAIQFDGQRYIDTDGDGTFDIEENYINPLMVPDWAIECKGDCNKN